MSGFTLVELLVVIAILVVLVSLLIPALQSAREAARFTACRNNVGQLARAFLHHESNWRCFPSAGWGDRWLGVGERGTGIQQPGGWSFSLLPYCEGTTLFDTVQNVPVAECSARYAELTTASLPVFACPGRRSSRPLPVASSYHGGCGMSIPVPMATRSDYAANAGTSASCPPIAVYRSIAQDPVSSGKMVRICHKTGGAGAGNNLTVSLSAMFGSGGHGNHDGDHVGPCGSCFEPVTVTNPSSLAEGDAWASSSLAARVLLDDGGIPDLQDGLVFRLSIVAPASVRDGLSNTYLVGEKYVAADRYSSGTDGGDGAPLFVGYSADNLRWADVSPTRDERGVSRPTAFGSSHLGGLAMAFADGSVHVLPFDIDPAVHKALAGRFDRIPASPP